MTQCKNSSPAVKSYKQGKAEQRDRGRKGELQRRLEGTFPASDPVSTTVSSILIGRTDPDEAGKVKQQEE
ncbi:hypothetical protein ATY81_25435 [Rhizobium sp. R72]|uniref:hypothetical protein n=1 Tax=unclassified Rhizobium TaxID=2613769 RepID=UPI000B537A11|nr:MULTISPECIES: hypothetical protein [unclassified Rhizobium]OWW00138.1 hypothetical protein ATY81_25435 [Rhizobium sp. R72]OWW00529.1 hypothetical protein ATY80_25435 [Rhizobium sp. R711]